MLDLLPYLAKAKHLPDLAPEIAYTVRPSFFYGSFNKPQPGDLRTQAVALSNPAFVRKQQALGLAAEGHEKQLVRYYQEVLRVMQQHRKDLRHCRDYFALRPVLLSKGQPILTFPWHETYPEAAGVLRALQAPLPEGMLLADMDQGWEIALYAQGERVYLAQGDGEDEKPYGLYYTGRARLAELAAATLARTQRQLAIFVRDTGQNPWQYMPEAPPRKPRE